MAKIYIITISVPLNGIMSSLFGGMNNQVSLYAFCEQVLGYNLANFFESHSTAIKQEIHEILKTLLSAEL